MGVKINLEEIGIEPAKFLNQLGMKLVGIFERAYDVELDKNNVSRSIENIVYAALELQSLDISYRRIFVIGIIEVFQQVRERNTIIDRSEAQRILRSTVKMLSEKEKEEVEKEEF
jgi:hypothetical protein